MKAIVNTGPNKLEMLELPIPEPKRGEVRIRTAACGICATDIEMIEGWSRTGFPSIPGHEWSGIVDAVGPEVDESLIGKHCVGENVLSDGGEVGFEHPGGYAEYFITEAANIYTFPDIIPWRMSVLAEPLAVCVRGLRRLRSDFKEPILIFGDGPIGLIISQLIACSRQEDKPEITLVGGRKGRLCMAEPFTRTINHHEAGIPNEKFPTIIEASGSPIAMNLAIKHAASGARILVLGDYESACADFEWNTILHKELEVIGSNASAGAWPEAVRLIVEENLLPDKLITHRFPAKQFEEANELVRSQDENLIKAVLEWNWR